MLEKIIDAMHWADRETIAWLKDGRGVYPNFLRLASHILDVETVWLCRIRGEAHDADVFKPIPLEEMEDRAEANRQGFRNLLETDLAREVDYRQLNGEPARSKVEDMILHAWTHGVHHRGQMAARASALGLKFPNVAYIQFTRQAPRG